MRLRNVKNKEEILNNCNFLIVDPIIYKGHWHELFKNNNPIYIEIGSGKGKFVYENALKYPNINFIGIEKFDSVLARLIERVKEELPNLYIIRMDALNIDEVFSHEIDRIYLNFSDPWPKKRHALRRLTSPVFLNKYENLFKNEKSIYLRTDNQHLFEYSIESMSDYGYKLKDVSLDLHKIEDEERITTEYEDKFVSLNNRIYELKGYKD
ncbi:MAG: tRNA (guanosine(46)-N7)-methyltransferase TrmB [Bacilli bacterium]